MVRAIKKCMKFAARCDSSFVVVLPALISLVLGMFAAAAENSRLVAAEEAAAATRVVRAAATSAFTTAAATPATEAIDELMDEDQTWTSAASDTSRVRQAHEAASRILSKYNIKVNPFWLGFEPTEPVIYYIFAVVYTLLFVTGCTGNFIVIFMFYKSPSLLTPATNLVLNLAVSDFIMLVKCPLAVYNNYMLGPASGDIGCRIYGFLGGLSGTTSILTLAAIAIDRYCVVVHPLSPLREDNSRPIYMIIFIWTYSIIFSIIPAFDFGLSTYVPEGLLTTCSFDYLDESPNARIYMFTFFVCVYIIPLLIILYCYFYILKEVCNSKRLHACRNRERAEQKLALVIVVVILVWFMAWTPYSVVAMMGVFGHKQHISPLISMGPAIFCKISACIDPYIYAATHPRFRAELRRYLNRSLGVRRFSAIGSSFRTRSTAANRMRSFGDLALEPSAPRPDACKLRAIAEEESVEEPALAEVVTVAVAVVSAPPQHDDSIDIQIDECSRF